MKYFITGAGGQLGFDIKRELLSRDVAEADIYTPPIEELDITDAAAVNQQLGAFSPDIIFHCAAFTNVDGAEANPEVCKKVNVEGTKNLVEFAKANDAKLIYISTDYVFDGENPNPYEVDDTPDPQSVYGRTKYEGEVVVRNLERHFIVRTAWVFGLNGKNFVRTMLSLAATKDEISVVADQYGSPTYTVDLARLLVDLSDSDKYGTYHATNEGFTTWADFTEYIFQAAGANTKVNKVSTAEYAELAGHPQAKRPHYSKLSKAKLAENGFETLPPWQDAVDRYIIELKKENEL